MSSYIKCDLCSKSVPESDYASRPQEWGKLLMSLNEYTDPSSRKHQGESVHYDLCIECYRKIRAQLG